MAIIKPKVRSKCVDSHIKMAYAKMAQAHYNRAIEEAKLMSADNGIFATNSRLRVIERYLETAGAEATRWGFRP